MKPASRDVRRFWAPTWRTHQPHASRVVRMTKRSLSATAVWRTRANERRRPLRNPVINTDSCMSFHPGHRANPRAVKSMMARPTLWSAADVEVMFSLTEGLTLHLYHHGTHLRAHAHDLAAIAHLLRITPRRPEGLSVGRVNFHNSVLALPADPRHSAGLNYFSFSTEPLAPCSFERDEELARDFESLTATLQLS